MLKVALIGCGGMGSTHARSWLQLKDKVELIAIADLMPEKAQKFAEKSGAKLYPNGDELLANEKPDIVDVCVPTFLHTKYAVAAMEMGCNVFIEKPVCLNEEEAQLLLETQKRTGVKVQVGQVIRFWDEYMYLKQVKDEGTFGKVLSGVFARLSSNPAWSWENWYNDYKRSGTVALDLHVHDLDFIRYFNGSEPEAIESVCTRDNEGVIQQIFSTYHYGDVVFTAEGCWDYPAKYPFSMSYRVKFEKATVVFDSTGKLTVYPVDGKPFEPELTKIDAAESNSGINVSNDGPYVRQLAYFVDHVINGEGVEIAPLCEAIASVRLAWKEIALSGGAKK